MDCSKMMKVFVVVVVVLYLYSFHAEARPKEDDNISSLALSSSGFGHELVKPCPGKGQSLSIGGCVPENATCNDPFPPIICDAILCVCPRGQVLDESTNACVNVSECCPVKGQVRKECASDPSCFTTCDNRFFFRFCPAICIVNGCECPSGTIIDEDQNECVPESECPEIPCPIEGQIFTSGCLPINATCSNPNPPGICDYPMCTCPRGQVIDEDKNACVNETDCRSCIQSLYVMGFTSGQRHAGSDSGHEVEIRAKGMTYKSLLPNLPGDDYKSNKGDLWKMSFKDHFKISSCVTADDVDYIAIVESSNDGWNIDSIVTFFYYIRTVYQLATVDFNVYRWIDGNGSASQKRFELTKAS